MNQLGQKSTYRILYLGYWNAGDPLTQATIFPNLQHLKNMEAVSYLHFVNTQREPLSKEVNEQVNRLGIIYTPIYSKNLPLNFVNKFFDFIHFPKQLVKICRQNGINLIIARGAPAGSLAFLVWKKLKIPFAVESFEPHADYMRNAGTWSPFGLKYLMQKHWEQQQKKHAKLLISVSNNYAQKLQSEGIEIKKIAVAPCSVDSQFFQYDEEKKAHYRKIWNWEDKLVGVYAGKFGGIYEDELAFLLFAQIFKHWGDKFRLLLLNNHSSSFIANRLNKYKIPQDRVRHLYSQPQEMPGYLSAADFALAPYQSNATSKFLSPVKIGEYWAIGLPILMPKNIGDDSQIIENEKVGLTYSVKDGDFSNMLKAFESQLKQQVYKRENIQRLAKQHRTGQRSLDAYHRLINTKSNH